MNTSRKERRWALQLKDAVAKAADVKRGLLTDLDYATYALVSRGNLEEALMRIRGVQQFQDYYQIDNSVDQGMFYLKELIRLQPGVILNLDICSLSQEGILALDLGTFNATRTLESSPEDTFHTSRSWKVHAVGFYYLLRALQPCLASVREGVSLLFDCDGMEEENETWDCAVRLHQEMAFCFPQTLQEILCYNTGYAATLFWSSMKPMLPVQAREVLRLGCQIDVQTIDPCAAPKRLRNLYLVPNREEATHHLLKRAEELLLLREKSQKVCQV